MLDKITDYLTGRVSETGYFEKIFPLVELVEREGAEYPAEYLGKGQYQSVSNFDRYNGLCYFRLNGKQLINSENSNGVSPDGFPACEENLQIIFPMRLVACVPKKSLSKDDAFTDERISRSLIAKILTDDGALKADLNASGLTILPDTVTFDNRQILSEEYRNVPGMKDVNYNLSYHCIDFRVVIRVSESCMINECEEEYYG